jgi:beta-galactosidase/beta-glucuronidase
MSLRNVALPGVLLALMSVGCGPVEIRISKAQGVKPVTGSLVATFDTTLDAQGYDRNTVFWYRTKITVPGKHKRLALFFGEVDGKAEVYVNGEKVAVPEKSQNAKKPVAPGVKPPRDGMAKPRTPFELDVTAAMKPGENSIAVRVDHSQITELSLGGIVRPVLLIAKPQ